MRLKSWARSAWGRVIKNRGNEPIQGHHPSPSSQKEKATDALCSSPMSHAEELPAIFPSMGLIPSTQIIGDQVAPWVSEQFTSAYTLLKRTLERSRSLHNATQKAILDVFSSLSQNAAKRGSSIINYTVILINAILASDFSRAMDTWLSELVNKGIPTIYDVAIDAVYNATHIGGGQLHRLVDGSHTLWDMWMKVRAASPEDTFLQQIMGYFSSLMKDLFTPTGLPLFGVSQPTYEQISDFLKANFSIPKAWLGDLLQVNAREILGTSIAVIAVALNWKKKDVKEFARLAGSLGVSSIASANPLLAIVCLGVLARSFLNAKQKDQFPEFLKGLATGGVGTGIFLASSSAIGGPVWVGLLTGLCLGVLANKALDSVDLSSVSRYVVTSFKKVQWPTDGDQPAKHTSGYSLQT